MRSRVETRALYFPAASNGWLRSTRQSPPVAALAFRRRRASAGSLRPIGLALRAPPPLCSVRRRTLPWQPWSANDAGDEERVIRGQKSQAHMIGVSAATPKVSYRPRRRRRFALAATEMEGIRTTTRTWLKWASGASPVTVLAMRRERRPTHHVGGVEVAETRATPIPPLRAVTTGV